MVYAQPRYLQDAARTSAKKAAAIKEKTPQRQLPKRDLVAANNTTTTQKVANVGAAKKTAADLLKEKRDKAAADLLARKRKTTTGTALEAPTDVGELTAVQEGESALDSTIGESVERTDASAGSRTSTIDRQRLQEMREKRLANYFGGTAKKAVPPPTSVRLTSAVKPPVSVSAAPPPPPSTRTKPIATTLATPSGPRNVGASTRGKRALPMTGSQSRPARTTAAVPPSSPGRPTGEVVEDEIEDLNSTVYQHAKRSELPQPSAEPAADNCVSAAVAAPRSISSMQTSLWAEQSQVMQLGLSLHLLEESRRAQAEVAISQIWAVSQHVDDLRQRIAKQEMELDYKKREWFAKQLAQFKAERMHRLGASSTDSLSSFAHASEKLHASIQSHLMRMPTTAIDTSRLHEAAAQLGGAERDLKAAVAFDTPRWRAPCEEFARISGIVQHEAADLQQLGHWLVIAAGISAVERSLLTHAT